YRSAVARPPLVGGGVDMSTAAPKGGPCSTQNRPQQGAVCAAGTDRAAGNPALAGSITGRPDQEGMSARRAAGTCAGGPASAGRQTVTPRARGEQLVGGHPAELVEVARQGSAERRDHELGVGVGAGLGLGDELVDW